jgi:synaptotagmin-1
VAYVAQVQPDMEELTENAEDGADEAESKQSEVKLGRLQYKVSSIYYISSILPSFASYGVTKILTY